MQLKEPGELVLYSPPECHMGIFCYYKDKACIYKHEGHSMFIANQICSKGNHCKFINKFCTLKHSLDMRIRGYINPNLVCDRRNCKGFDINTCTKLHACDYDECMRHAFTFRIVQDGVMNFMENILPKMNSDRIMKKMGLPILSQLVPPMDRSRNSERHRSRSRDRHSSRNRSRSRERHERHERHEKRDFRDRSRSRDRRNSRYRSRSHERHRSRSRDRFVSQRPPEDYQRPPEAYQRPPELFQRQPVAYQRPLEAYQRPPELFQRQPVAYQRPPELFQRQPEAYQRPFELFQRPSEDYQRPPIRVNVSSDPPRRIITIQPKQTDIHNLINSAINEGKNKIIINVNDFETKCRNVPNCYLHNFKACKFMHKDQIDECLALYEATKNIKLAQDQAKKMMDSAQERFRNSSSKKSSNGRYFDVAPDYIPLPF